MGAANQAVSTEGLKPNMARFIASKDFMTPKAKAACIAENKTVVLGQVVGVVYGVTPKTITRPDGEAMTSLQATGEFEGIVYESGEVIESNVMYLPGYFAQLLSDQIARTKEGGAVQFAVEMLVVPTGKTIPFAYEVRNLLPPSNLLNNLKAGLAKRGLLKLPAPEGEAVAAIEGHVDAPQVETKKAAKAHKEAAAA